MQELEISLQVLFWGLYSGCIYILLATGLNLIFGVMKTVNFAHGEFLMIGAYVTASLFALTGLNPYAIILFSMAILALLGVVIERLCFRPILGKNKLNEIFLSLGLIYILQNTAALIWTDDWQGIHSPYESITIAVGSIRVPLDYFIIMGVTVAILCGLYLSSAGPAWGVQYGRPARTGGGQCSLVSMSGEWT